MIRNPFRNPTTEEAEAKARQEKEIKDKIKVVTDKGRRVVSSSDFQDYKKDLQGATQDIIKLMINHPNPDPVKDAFFLRTCLAKIGALMMLTEAPERDAKR